MKQTPLFPTRKEIYFGWRYLAFQVLVLPYLLGFLPLNLNSAQLNFLYFSLNFGCILFFFRKFLLESLQAAKGRMGRILLTAVLGFAVYYLLSMGMDWLFARIAPEYINMNDQSIADMSQESFLMMFIGTVVLVPLTEECLNRGSVFAGLYGKNRYLAYGVSITVFSLIHMVNYIGIAPPLATLFSFLQYVPAGLCLAATYEISGSIFAPVLIHTAVNAIGMMAMR